MMSVELDKRYSKITRFLSDSIYYVWYTQVSLIVNIIMNSMD